MILPAQEGEDVLEFEQVQCARPVEETQPPPQDPRQRQVGLGSNIESIFFSMIDRELV